MIQVGGFKNMGYVKNFEVVPDLVSVAFVAFALLTYFITKDL